MKRIVQALRFLIESVIAAALFLILDRSLDLDRDAEPPNEI